MLKWLKKATAGKAPDAAVRPPGLKRQGDEHAKAGRYADAERCYRQVMDTDADFPGALVMLGFVLKEQGRVADAREVLDRAVRLAGEDADAHFLLGSVLEAAGPAGAGVSHLQRAVELRPGFEFARRQLIVALSQSGRSAQAMELCEASLGVLPESSELHFYRSNLYLLAGEKALALASCERALALNPAFTAAQQSLSRLLVDSEQFERAEISYRREIELTPEQAGPHHELAVVLNGLGRHAEAIELFKRAIALNPNSGASYSSLGAAYIDANQTSGEFLALALASHEKAVALEPENADLHYNLGDSYQRAAQLDRALASYDRAIALNPNHVRARWVRAMLWSRAFASQDVGNAADRGGFARELARFEDWWVKSDTDGAAFVGEAQPFFLSYQEESNLTLLKDYGRICALAMQRWLDRQKSPAFKRPAEKRVRLGIVSADIRLHSVWIALIKGWLQSFDRERFELVIFSLADRTDRETSWARERADIFVGPPRTLDRWVAAMREQNCEILLYPAIGLDSLVTKLAGLRLAPVQIVAWGHPETSGLPTLDYYLSAECFEPADAQDHYCERLVQLPNLGTRLQPLSFSSIDFDLSALNIDLERPILVCPGTPFKYQPAHDHVFIEIARGLPEAQLLFFRPSAGALADLLEARITERFEAAGLEAAHHLRFIRWLDFEEFHYLLRRADVMLDTIGFSGYNTAVQAIECGLPLVTREGRFLRGRLASGVLRRMGLSELIVQTEAEYVTMAVRLVADGPYRAHIRDEIRRRGSVLFDDQSAMAPFQDFLESVARPA